MTHPRLTAMVIATSLLLCIWLAQAPVADALGSSPGHQLVSAAFSLQTDADPAPDPPDGSPGFLPDPREWAAEVFNQLLVNLLQGIANGLRSLVDGVLGSSLNFISQTPPAGSYASPTVKTLWELLRAIGNAALVLVALWGGFNLIFREHFDSPYHEAMELFPRLALGALLANSSLWWTRFSIDANNALCSALGQASLPAWEHADTTSQLLVEVISTLIYLIASLLLLLQMLMRLALIDVLLVVSPIALLCWVLPQTQGWARLWSATFFGAVFTQFVQMLTLKLGASLLTDLTPMAADASLLALFLGVAVIVLAMRVPSLMRNHLGDGLGFVRYLVYRQGARMLDSRSAGTSRTGGRS